jgi:hypothetical protein
MVYPSTYVCEPPIVRHICLSAVAGAGDSSGTADDALRAATPFVEATR